VKWGIEDWTRHVLTDGDTRHAIVSKTYYYGDGTCSPDALWRVYMLKTSEAIVLPTLEQAKDWAQAVASLNH
jgi:hypothetical protein